MAGMVADLQAQPEAMRKAAAAGYPTATDLADWLVRTLGKPFREAHHTAGAVVKRADDLGLPLESVPLAEMQQIEPGITKDVFSVLSLAASVESRKSYGGTAPERVREQIAYWRKQLS
jgi:argininosuccinate lyase